MITTIIISIAVIFVMLGALISAFAAIGLIRLKDVYSRAHAAGKAATLGSDVSTLWCLPVFHRH